MKPRSLPPAVPVTSLRVFEPVQVFPPARWDRWRDEVTRADATERAADAERREAWRRLLRRPSAPFPTPGGPTSGGPTHAGHGPAGNGRAGNGLVGNGQAGSDGQLDDGPGGDGETGRGRRGNGQGGAGELDRAQAGTGRGHGAGRGGPGSGADRAGARADDEAEDGDPLADYVRVLRVDGALLICPASLGDGAGPRRTLVRAWDLPLPWMLAIALADRPQHTDPDAGRYVIAMARARAQAARALRTLRTRLRGTEVTAEVEVLARWLEGFHPRSWVELDARPVVALLGGDDGLEDVRFGLECLATGDSAGAALAYQRLRQRSRTLTDISRLS